MDDYWQQSGETVTVQQSYQAPPISPDEQNDDQFDFTATQNNPSAHQTLDYNSTIAVDSFSNMQKTEFGQLQQGFEEDEVAKQIRKEEERINQKLQQKANQEYELKLQRKQQGRKWLQEFFDKKQQQIAQRKQENIKHQQNLVNEIRKGQTTQGWTKVSKSVDLKQSDYKGSKEINRMRQAIIHKREDESSA